MRLAMFKVMNTDEGDQKLWFVLDELDALNMHRWAEGRLG